MKNILPLAAVLLLSSGAPALALRCGTRLVTEGQSKYDVMQVCGEPSYADSRVEYRPGPGAINPSVPMPLGPNQGYYPGPNPYSYPYPYPTPYPAMQQVVIDEWVYNFGPTQLMSSLLFENDRLVKIRSLGYGR